MDYFSNWKYPNTFANIQNPSLSPSSSTYSQKLTYSQIFAFPFLFRPTHSAGNLDPHRSKLKHFPFDKFLVISSAMHVCSDNSDYNVKSRGFSNVIFSCHFKLLFGIKCQWVAVALDVKAEDSIQYRRQFCFCIHRNEL